MARKIRTIINKERGANKLPEIKSSIRNNNLIIDEESENGIHEYSCEQMLQQYRNQLLSDSDYFSPDLELCLERRGWWKNYNLNYFIKLNWEEKLLELLYLFKLTSGELQKILELDDIISAKISAKNIKENDLKKKDKQGFNCLLSILSYLMRISSYEPLLMSEFFNAKELYSGTENIAPWNNIGLKNYLLYEGRKGVINSVNWIRNIS
jgi:hypothetical protein